QSHWTSIINAGLCGLSACAKEAGYSDIHLLDIRQLKNWDAMEDRFKEIDPDLVGLTMRSCDYKIDLEIARRLKNLKPGLKTVVGGVHVSIDPDFVQGFPEYDYIISGEGEITFVDLLKALDKGDAFPRFSAGEKPDLDSLPYIDRELYPYQTSINLPNYEGVFRPPMVTMLCARGCPYKCSFCYPHSMIHFGTKVRQRSAANVIDELDLLYDRYRFECVKFYDYTFTLDTAWGEEFCDQYAHIGKPFWIQSRADLVARQPDLIGKLKKVGLKMIGIGFESGSDRVLKALRKRTTRNINLEAAQVCKEHEVLISASFMLGTPTEEEDDVKATISLAKEMKPEFTSISFFTPIPGNDLYRECKEKNLIISEDPEMWVEFSPEIPKIKNKDYKRLKRAAAEIMGDRFGGTLTGKLIRYLYVKTKYHYRLRNFLVYLYSRWVSSSGYRLIQRHLR
ncbi:MAG: B12-binding domain-containing radical SAM protein, partial [Deltaproteobacteria bacterium]|nr:B12-binding domain-containing radical SAM protein [Deltaproteobacteria bacterium]